MIRFAVAALALWAAAAPVRAEETRLARFRGTVEARDTDTLTVKQHEGGSVTVRMNPKTRLLIATAGRLRDIKPESYVSVVAVPGADGTLKPALVTIYSPSERGFEAGTRPWDLGADSTFTAGWIRALSINPPRQVELIYDGGTGDFTIPPGTPTTQVAPGEKSLLAEGADVVVFARTDKAGLVNADVVVVGRRGIVPTF